MAQTKIALPTAKTFTSTHIIINNTSPDLIANVLRVSISYLDSANNVIGKKDLTIPFASLEGAWTGKVSDTVVKAVLAVV
jgi:hypothetical protein